MASRSEAPGLASSVLERGRIGGIGLGELVGGAAGNGRWCLLREAPNDLAAVSYTHLTLPTILLV